MQRSRLSRLNYTPKITGCAENMSNSHRILPPLDPNMLTKATVGTLIVTVRHGDLLNPSNTYFQRPGDLFYNPQVGSAPV